jgi:hypothetical protein
MRSVTCEAHETHKYLGVKVYDTLMISQFAPLSCLAFDRFPAAPEPVHIFPSESLCQVSDFPGGDTNLQ